jgi:hypothetical protein
MGGRGRFRNLGTLQDPLLRVDDRHLEWAQPPTIYQIRSTPSPRLPDATRQAHMCDLGLKDLPYLLNTLHCVVP